MPECVHIPLWHKTCVFFTGNQKNRPALGMKKPKKPFGIRRLDQFQPLHNPSTSLHNPTTLLHNPSTILHNPSTILAVCTKTNPTARPFLPSSPLNRAHHGFGFVDALFKFLLRN